VGNSNVFQGLRVNVVYSQYDGIWVGVARDISGSDKG